MRIETTRFLSNVQWITPPARMEFERYFRAILAKYEVEKTSKQVKKVIEQINLEDYFHSKGYR